MYEILASCSLSFSLWETSSINMTNHFQHSPLIHALWGYPVYTARCCTYRWFGTHTHTHTHLLCMCGIQILAGLTYIIVLRKDTGFFISRAEPDLNDSHCDLFVMTASSPHYLRWPRFSQTLELRKIITLWQPCVVWIRNAVPSDCPQSKFFTTA